VIRVAALASFGVGLTMEPVLLFKVSPHLFVAGDALGFERPAEGRVTVKTFVLDLGMWFGNLAGHHPLEKANAVGHGRPDGEEQQEERKTAEKPPENQPHTVRIAGPP
jgi:hypothetical protein